MSRIRTIKPEFWVSAQIMECSHSARLLFIGLWNFCDDHGVHPANLRQLKAEVFPGDDIILRTLAEWVQELFSQHLIAEFDHQDKTYWYVTGWHHQRIDKPSCKYPEPNGNLRYSSTILRTFLECSTNVLPSSVKEGSLKEGSLPYQGTAPEPIDDTSPIPPTTSPALDKPTAKTTEVWEAYSAAYFLKYGTQPVRNAKVNSQLSHLIDRLGAEEAPQVAAFYVQHNNAFYVRNGHAVGFLLNDAEKLRTEWATGRMLTQQEAYQIDRTQSNYNAFAPLLAEAKAKESRRGH